MDIKNIHGLKFPDDYFIKFFFKYSLHSVDKKVFLELGSSNGCNLSLPYQYNNDVIGVDLNPELVLFSNKNFQQFQSKASYVFYEMDMCTFCENRQNINADILVLANSIYYISKEKFIRMLRYIKKNRLIKKGIPLFIRFRGLNDFRFAKGNKVEKNGYIIQNGITGEDGTFCHFYSKEEMIEILSEELNLRKYQVMMIAYENIQNNTLVNNEDYVIWGTIN